MHELLKIIKIVDTFKQLGLRTENIASMIVEGNVETLLFANAFSKDIEADFVVMQSDGSIITNSFKNNSITTIKGFKSNNIGLYDSFFIENHYRRMNRMLDSFLSKALVDTDTPMVLFIDKLDEFPVFTDFIVHKFLQTCKRENTWLFISVNENAKRNIEEPLMSKSFSCIDEKNLYAI